MFIALKCWVITNLLLFFFSIFRIKKSQTNVRFIYSWGFLFGAFVWEDLMIFSFFHFLSTSIALLLNDFRFFLLFFLTFWLVRSLGETLYFFLQQFIRPKHHPHEISKHFKLIKFFLGNVSNQKSFIIVQVFQQIVATISLSLLILLFLYWHILPASFYKLY